MKQRRRSGLDEPRTNEMRLDKRWWLLVVLAGLLVLFFGLDLGRFLSLAAVKSSQADLQAWRAGSRCSPGCCSSPATSP